MNIEENVYKPRFFSWVALIQLTQIWCQNRVLIFENSKSVKFLMCRLFLFLKMHSYSESRKNSKTNGSIRTPL